MRSIVMTMSVCLSVCPLMYLENYTTELHQFLVYVAHGRSSVVLCWRCDTLCTSGFVDDVTFSHNGAGHVHT